MAATRFLSLFFTVQSAQRAIARAALEGAAIAVVNEAKRNVRGGFRSGRFVTGNLFNQIFWTVVETGDRLEAQIGTPVDYGAFWAFGHHNIFTRRFERDPWLQDAFRDTTAEQRENAEIFAANAAKKFVRL